MKSSEIKWFRHDSSARNDLKLQKLMAKYGAEGYGLFWVIIEMMHENNGTLELSEDDMLLIKNQSQTKCDVTEFINKCVKMNLLVKENDILTSKRVSEFLELKTDFKEFGKKGAIKRWKKDPKEPVHDIEKLKKFFNKEWNKINDKEVIIKYKPKPPDFIDYGVQQYKEYVAYIMNACKEVRHKELISKQHLTASQYKEVWEQNEKFKNPANFIKKIGNSYDDGVIESIVKGVKYIYSKTMYDAVCKWYSVNYKDDA